MIQFKGSGLNKSEISEVRSLVDEIVDKFADAYITKNNLRLMIKENFDILSECLKKGDKIAFDENGLVVVLGYSDNSSRKYLKILTKDVKYSKDATYVDSLLKIMFWNLKEKEVYIKLKNNNPLKEYLLSKSSVYLYESGKYFANGVSVDTKKFYSKFDKTKAKLLFSGFEFVGGRGKESLLRYVAIESREPAPKYFSKDKDE